MKKSIKRKIFNKFFKEFEKIQGPRIIYSDIDEDEINIISKVERFSLTGIARLASLIKAVKHVEKYNVSGSIVECGVYKGGSVMAALETLKNLKSTSRELYLYDTYEGMTAPSMVDTTFEGKSAEKAFEEKNEFWDHIACYSSLQEVKDNIETCDYPMEKIHFIQGKVEDTIPIISIPDKIAILRLDTDFYESTRHELEHLFPRLEKGGILIIDDYGHWQGCKKAVDEYIEKNNIQIFLNRIDYSCRLAVKQ